MYNLTVDLTIEEEKACIFELNEKTCVGHWTDFTVCPWLGPNNLVRLLKYFVALLLL